ncbi:MAG: CHC2 zinc finger domain-containing protein, partial [Candidatus Omnitrophica bacterium]|nr:CHC2 zinc finger domain-containing protein [Candidatus Omnitrophota bacterium]
MAIPENIINSIRDRADIVEIIDSILPLKKIGANFKALCPFHHEKTPSFVVSAQKQIFHCFGCGEGGNVFHFLIKHQNMSFVDAVKYVASIVGIDVPDSDMSSDYKDILALNKTVADLYSQNLVSEDAGKCRSYIESRGLKEDTLKTFNLGYAPESWDFLVKKLRAKGFQQQHLFKAGLVARGKDGNSFYDIFRDRLIFPIVDHTEKVL